MLRLAGFIREKFDGMSDANHRHECISMAQVQIKSICANQWHKCKLKAYVQIIGTSANHGHKCKSWAQVQVMGTSANQWHKYTLKQAKAHARVHMHTTRTPSRTHVQ